MAYITKAYYLDTFHGIAIEDQQFDRLAQAASDIIDAIVLVPINPEKVDMDSIAKATAYQMEMLAAQGGIDAIVGLSSQSITSEQLGDYRVSGESATGAAESVGNPPAFNGIPVSPIALAILRKAGLMQRWLYAPLHRKNSLPHEPR